MRCTSVVAAPVAWRGFEDTVGQKHFGDKEQIHTILLQLDLPGPEQLWHFVVTADLSM